MSGRSKEDSKNQMAKSDIFFNGDARGRYFWLFTTRITENNRYFPFFFVFFGHLRCRKALFRAFSRFFATPTFYTNITVPMT